MCKLFLIGCFLFCLFSCNIQFPKLTTKSTTEPVNKYTTSPEISILTTDLPKYKTTPAPAAPPPKKPEKNNTSSSLDTNNISGIQIIDTSAFFWEIGIKQTQILDVRTFAEYKSGHIYDAINMNVKATGFIHQIQTLDKSSPVAVYCRSGTQSIQAAKILRDNGFEIIYVLKGGLNQWIKDGKEIVK